MSLLDGMQELFGEVFSDIFPIGILHKMTLVDDGRGGYTTDPSSHPIYVLEQSATDQMRSAADYTEKDVALIILQHEVPWGVTADDEITSRGVRYKVRAPIDTDPVQAAWIVRGSPA